MNEMFVHHSQPLVPSRPPIMIAGKIFLLLGGVRQYESRVSCHHLGLGNAPKYCVLHNSEYDNRTENITMSE